MNELIINDTTVVFKQQEDSVFTDSLTIAKVFGKEHGKVLVRIREKEHLFTEANFSLSDLLD